MKDGYLYVQMPNGSYLIYNYDKLKDKFNGRDPTKMTPREVFDKIYRVHGAYINPYKSANAN